MNNDNEFFDGIAGGGDLTAEKRQEGVFEVGDLIVSSPLDQELARFLALHPALRLKFRNNNLSSLDDNTKQTLLKDIQRALGITPLRNG